LQELKLAVFDEPEAGIDLWSFHRLAETFNDTAPKNGHHYYVHIPSGEKDSSVADETILMAEGGI
jgi:Fe-S cluster assembly ATP-binding protein